MKAIERIEELYTKIENGVFEKAAIAYRNENSTDGHYQFGKSSRWFACNRIIVKEEFLADGLQLKSVTKYYTDGNVEIIEK